MKKRIYISGLLLLLLLSSTVQANPQISVPWSCNFEQGEDLSDWVLNPGTSDATDQWVIGTATRSIGKQSLYISTTGGLTAIAGAKQNTVMAYRTIHFPEHSSGYREYDISFDWKALGAGELYVFFDYASKLTDLTYADNIIQYASPSKSTNIPKELLNSAKYVYNSGTGRQQAMSGTNRWAGVSIDNGAGSTYSVRLSSKNAKKDCALVFVWINKNTMADSTAMGACIDNIQIASAKLEKPTNLKATLECDSFGFWVTWTGNISDYAIEYRSGNQSSWRKHTHQGTPNQFKYLLNNLKEATYDIRVRGWGKVTEKVKGSDGKDSTIAWIDTTAYTTINNQTLLCLDNHCINYVDLDNALCTYGPMSSGGGDTYKYLGRVDYGFEEYNSFHTVCMDQNATDIRTNNKLKIIPENEMATVRLGTWISPGSNKTYINDSTTENIGCYSVTYDLTVNTAEQALILLKYAMVMENPVGHSETEMPFFRLEILDENGVELSNENGCGSKQFYCPADTTAAEAEGWNIFRTEEFPYKSKEMGFNSTDIFWKDWTAMGLNLKEVGAKDGDKLKVRIIAKGCTLSGHYGYGYFTLDCANATIETDQCSGQAEVTADAPEGFSYNWYKQKNQGLYNSGIKIDENGEKVIVSNSYSLQVNAGDTNVYVCRLIDKIEPACYFELQTKLSPRSPKPIFKSVIAATECQNIILITDSSRVVDYDAEGHVHMTTERCEWSDFTVRSLVTGTTTLSSSGQFKVQAQTTGDTLEVIQTSYISGGECATSQTDTITIPNITSPDSVWKDTVCRNIGYTFYGEKLITSGTYSHEMKNRYGCDSIEILYLTVNPVSVTDILDTISSLSLPYELSGTYKGETKVYEKGVDSSYITTQNYTVKFSNTYDCDSTVNLRLTVVPQLLVDVDSIATLCADDGILPIRYEITNGDFEQLNIHFNASAQSQHFRDTTIVHNPYAPRLEDEETIRFAYNESVYPDVYMVTLEFVRHPSCGPNPTYTLPIKIYYASSIIQQKWNDVLAVHNASTNGGYMFTDYQWYKNGIAIEGATLPYLYGDLDMTAEYCVKLTRPDGVTQYTCRITPTNRTPLQQTQFPTFVRTQQMVPIRFDQSARINILTPTGALYESYNTDGELTSIQMPQQGGYYIVNIVFTDGPSENHKILVSEN